MSRRFSKFAISCAIWVFYLGSWAAADDGMPRSIKKPPPFARVSVADRVSPECETANAMDQAETRIENYVAEKHSLPKALTDVQVRPDHGDDGNIDGWGQPLIYEPQKDGSVILRSNGAVGQSRSVQFYPLNPLDTDDLLAQLTTHDRMWNIEMLVHQYAIKQKRVPKTIAELTAGGDGGLDASEVDGWKRTIRYAVDSNGTVTLISDEKPGLSHKIVLNFDVPEATKLAKGPTTNEAQGSKSR
jgi:hypothetical protein